MCQASSAPDQIFKWYGSGYGRVLRCFSRFFVQNEESKELLNKIGISDAMVVGDTRFDRVLQIKEARNCHWWRISSIGMSLIVEKSSLQDRHGKISMKKSSLHFNKHKDWKTHHSTACYRGRPSQDHPLTD